MIKLIRRRALLLILALMLMGAVGAFNFSTPTAQATDYTCPAPDGCGNWGCYANLQGQQKCTLYNLEGSTHCAGSIDCEVIPEYP